MSRGIQSGLIGFVLLCAVLSGAIGGADDGTVARIEREVAGKAILMLLGKAHAQGLALPFYLVFVAVAAWWVQTDSLNLRRTAVAIIAAQATVGALVFHTVVRLSTMYVGTGSIAEFVVGVLALGLVLFMSDCLVVGICALAIWGLRRARLRLSQR